jgi:soluble lytic murein transglycosylase-like protein
LSASEILTLVRKTADEMGLDADLACAIAITESAANPLATRFEPEYRWFFEPAHFAHRLGITEATERTQQATSWGSMQIMGAVARELGFNEPLVKLAEPETGALYGCKKLKSLSDRYENEQAVIAAFNAGSPRKVAPPKSFGGNATYVNQSYVDKVLKQLKLFRNQGK